MKLRFNKNDVLIFNAYTSSADRNGNRYQTRGSIYLIRKGQRLFINDFGGWNNLSGLAFGDDQMVKQFMHEFFGIEIRWISDYPNIVTSVEEVSIRDFNRIENNNLITYKNI